MTVEEKAEKIRSLIDHHLALFETLKRLGIPSGFNTTVQNGLKAGLTASIADIAKQ